MQIQKPFLVAGWVTYAAYYVARVTLSVAKPLLAKAGVSYLALGWLDFGFLSLYVIGQIVNGRMADRVSARKLMFAGLLLSTLLNFALVSTGFGIVGFLLWMAHGFTQSMGWSPLVKGAKEGVGELNRPLAMCFVSTAPLLGSFLGNSIGGWAANWLSWRGPFLLPMLITPIVISVCYRNLATTAVVEKKHATPGGEAPSKLPVSLWLFAGVLLSVNILRYGLLLWLPALFDSTGRWSIQVSGFWTAVVVGSGLAGILGTGFLIRGKSAPFAGAAAGGSLLAVGILNCLLPLVRFHHVYLVLILIVISACIHGAHAISVSVMPAALSPEGKVGRIVGAVDAVGYIGTGAAGLLTGYLAGNGAWGLVFREWAVIAIMGALLAVTAASVLRLFDSAPCGPAMRQSSNMV